MKKIRILVQTLPVLILLLLFGCQDDSFVETKQNEASQSKLSFKVSTIFKQDIQANEKLTAKIIRLIKPKHHEIGKNIYNETYDFTINTDAARLIENSNDNGHSYTFPINRGNYTNSDIENLVFTYDELNDDYNAGLVTHHLTLNQKQEYLTTSQISTPFNVSFSSLDINIAEILNKNQVPCTVTFQEFHTPHDSENTHLYTSNGVVVNPCFHQGPEEEPCTEQTIIVIDCPDSGGAPSSPHDTSSPDPSGTDTNDYSNAGGSGNTNDDTATNNEPTDTNVVTSLMTNEESIRHSILNCINGNDTTNFNTTMPLLIETLENLNLTLEQLNSINTFLNDNGCNESIRIQVKEELLEEAISNAIIPPSCKSFNFSNVGVNWQAAATKNIVALIGYYDIATGEYNTANILFIQPIYFEMPKNSEANGGYISHGRAAELTSKAVFLAIRRAKAYFLATNASESQVRAKLWEYIRDEMTNGTYVVGGRASFTPPFGYSGGIVDYKSYWFLEDNCD